MKLQFWALGKDHETYVKQGVDDFTKRINNYYPASWKIIPAPKNAALLTEDDLKKKEAESILKQVSENDYLVALDEQGKTIRSEQLATFIQQRANESSKQLIFLIGGAFGLHAQLIKRANFQLSLSALTFPHQLVRLILAEQVYRACTILRNEKYHHI
jgi:23S rRNA (pseudouridine1915-N3)-methyltransferase